ncbi:MAG: pyridoxal phosphate-dependent aminotransferase, partial [Candidatus Carbobacillus sp.]|nr:pyridoxal phosphate-dependent aminotransferase [Candidatus Carbobacillus sp.]
MHASLFDQPVDRRGSASIKWDAYPRYFELNADEALDMLPMWVADMDFPAPQAVLDTLRKRLDHGILGYTTADHALIESIRYW